MLPNMSLVHTTTSGTQVFVEPGNKSRWDFIVSYSLADGSSYRVFHSDLVVDLYRKKSANPDAAQALVGDLLGTIAGTSGVEAFPPELVQFDIDKVNRFARMGLSVAGSYDLELFLILFELVQIQEETNYPRGWLPRTLFEHIRDAGDDLERVAYLTEIGVPRRENRRSLAAKDQLLRRIREVFGR